jgi:hypothetical protein
VLEKLHGSFVFFRGASATERPKVPSSSTLGIDLARIQPILARFQFANHGGSSEAISLAPNDGALFRDYASRDLNQLVRGSLEYRWLALKSSDAHILCLEKTAEGSDGRCHSRSRYGSGPEKLTGL